VNVENIVIKLMLASPDRLYEQVCSGRKRTIVNSSKSERPFAAKLKLGGRAKFSKSSTVVMSFRSPDSGSEVRNQSENG
jgi:hypothetical protein